MPIRFDSLPLLPPHITREMAVARHRVRTAPDGTPVSSSCASIIWRRLSPCWSGGKRGFRLENTPSAAPNSWSRGLVCVRLDCIQVDQNTRVIALVCPRQRDHWARCADPPAGDLNLRAGNVELRLVCLHCHVEGDLFNPKKVLAVGNAGRDCCVDGFVRVCSY